MRCADKGIPTRGWSIILSKPKGASGGEMNMCIWRKEEEEEGGLRTENKNGTNKILLHKP